MPVIDTIDARIHYTRIGNGPAVIMVQGVGVIGRGWTPQAEELANTHSVITIDNRGIGRSTTTAPLTIESMAADVVAVADAERIERFHLVGHSMGGVIAQQVALTARSRVASLVLMCTFLKGRQGASMSPALFVTAIRSRIGTRRMRRHAFVEMVMPAGYLASVDRDALCTRLADLFGRDLADSPPILMRQLRAMSRFDASRRLAELAGIPTTVVSAEHDRIARPEYGRALAAAIPGARYVEIRDAGHACTIQSAAAVNELILAQITAAPVTR